MVGGGALQVQKPWGGVQLKGGGGAGGVKPVAGGGLWAETTARLPDNTIFNTCLQLG